MYIGTNREHSKIIGGSLMVIGFFLATPPGVIPDDFLDVFIAGLLVKYIGIGMVPALVITYTVIAWGIILAGAMIYPYNTKRLLNGKKNQMQAILKKTFSDPWMFALLIIGFILIYELYEVWIQCLL